ncbi:MAG: hypothetical protein A3B91_00435 [Candidatus Yanofskybacteria bacterium RIFCSPHIGHO2_02_FULL_41_29]|nr:MAG: hypothetical protein A3B91_00435 [Candidatus Yanofskybacteria bacterium RIFCSPHIGHO2_02_FULL_41_29]OGN22848.1 MAG: hypothetical protein A2916_02030 [Candidatus Yanofskybacteria bacterium RIFCSPLOWO2_01_FULL_41_67]OGN30115.1 MAG: hypothetical protein A3H54_03075 [Candidatus Yanofskybacteria bacterium RIFCSPLOWO2_02_FULL_41_13]
MRKLSLTHLVILLCLAVFAFSTHSIASQKDGLLKVHFLDIGQGDAIFIETPSGFQLLIDGGPGNQVLSKLGEVMPFYDKSIDLVVLTHPHFDHYAGLIEVLSRYDVDSILEAKEEDNTAGFSAWREAVKNEGTNQIEAVASRTINLGDETQLVVLYPKESLEGQNFKNPNDSSVVLMLKYKELEVLLTGDIETKGERAMLLDGINLDADVVKIAHHGSKTSSTEELLSAVSPEVAIIQVGEKNRYGHPSPEVLERLENYDIKYYRNDLDGDVKLISDGLNYQIITY